MQKLKKICVIMLGILPILVMTSCVSKPKVNKVLPPRPVRPELNPPESDDDDYAWEVYYNHAIDSLEYTITLWEYWADVAEGTTEK